MIAGYNYDTLDYDAILEALKSTDYLMGKHFKYQFYGNRKNIEIKLAKDDEGTGMIFIETSNGCIDEDAIIVMEYFTIVAKNRG